MKCNRCGKNFAAGLDRCPHCGMDIHYGGSTEFYGKAVQNKLTVADFFTDVLKKHPKGTGAKMFMAGTPTTTPTPGEMLNGWQKPWLFGRVFAVGLAFAAICYFLASSGLTAATYSLFSLCALITPISLVIFYWEANIPRDIPLYTVLLIMVIGGGLSILFLYLLPSLPGGAWTAAFTEEPAKLIAVAIFVYVVDPKYIFGGLLIGAAVGGGFACMENIYYVFDKGGVSTLLLRSVTALGGHVAYAGIEGGALLMAKGGEKLSPKHFADPRFLAGFGVSIALHYINNSSFTLGYIPFFGDLKYLLKLIAALLAMFFLLKKAVAQVLTVVDAAQLQRAGAQAGPTRPAAFVPASAPAQAVLTALSGPLAGSAYPFGQNIVIGRDPALCQVVFPADAPGISRKHCTLERRPDGFYLMDHGTTYGTFTQSGRRLPPNQWIRLDGPFCLGGQGISFSCRYRE